MTAESTDAQEYVAQPLRTTVPFLTTSFAKNLWGYALLWPVWWALGIEQFLLPFFLLFEMVRFLVAANWSVRINTTALLALLLALWWAVPIFWVDREFLDLFLRETATIWAQAFVLILFWNRIRTQRDWQLAVRALLIMATYTAVAGLIYMSGIWRGNFLSLAGRLMPSSLIANSSFFSSIAIREFGSLANEVGLLTQRLMAFSLSFSALSMIALLLIPIVYWRFQLTRSMARLFYGGVALGLVLCLFFTESRISYAAFLAAIALYAILRLGLLRGSNRPLTVALSMVGAALTLLVAYVLVETILQSAQAAFVDLRPGSWQVRLQIYLATLQLLPEHLIAGWGVPVRLPGLPSDYSAGTHSNYLGVLFQHGIIGLLLYIGLWLSVWTAVIRGLSQRENSRELAMFWIAAATAFFAFNIREIADSWLFDQSLTFVVWLMWGVALTAARCAAADAEPVAVSSSDGELVNGLANEFPS